MKSRERGAILLAEAGITIDGNNSWDPQIHNERLFDRIFAGGTLALGESYMDSWWDVEDLSEFVFRLFRTHNSFSLFSGVGVAFQIARSKILNLQTNARAFEVGAKHYGIGNDLYEKMLGPRMVYSCGYWKDADTLAAAQEAKLDLICRKIGLKNGDTLLDIGCGWGGFAQFASEKYGAKVVGITISKEQADVARTRTAGLPVEIRLQDWRDLGNESFSHVVSIGMFEHVGPKNYREFMEKVRSVLSDDGLFLLHTIGHSKVSRSLERWFNKYIFPNGHLPSITHISAATDRRNLFDKSVLTMEDWHNFGADYDKTLMAWYANFEHAWPDLKGKYDERFYRMWKYYLLVSAGMFRARYLHLWQIVYSKNGIVGGYTSVR